MGITLPLIIAGTSFVLLVVLGRLFTLEKRAGKRFVLPTVRFAIDNLIVAFTDRVHRLFVYIIKYVITLSWYYSLHAFLGVTLKFLASIYYMVENITHRNRDKARKIRQERKQSSRTHLEVLVDHKDETKLTETQKKKLKDKAINQK
ncbi:hypothetical protein K2P47_05380 [Patescibacteria group bacterium]|nr:hypothetical protein [Patescibacteria group bacterium]